MGKSIFDFHRMTIPVVEMYLRKIPTKVINNEDFKFI